MLYLQTISSDNKIIETTEVEEISSNHIEQVDYAVLCAKDLLKSQDFKGKNVFVSKGKKDTIVLEDIIWRSYYGSIGKV